MELGEQVEPWAAHGGLCSLAALDPEWRIATGRASRDPWPLPFSVLCTHPCPPHARLATGLAQPVAIKIQNSPSWSLRILPQDRARRPPCWDLFVSVFERGCLQGAARTRGQSLWCWERYCKRAVDLDFPLIFRVSIYLLVKRG